MNIAAKRDPLDRGVLRERRLNMRLMAFWWDRRAGRRFPTRADFSGEELTDIWHHCFTLVPEDPLSASTFAYIGETVANLSGIDEPAPTLGQLPENTLLGQATGNAEKVLAQKIPLIASGEFVDFRGQEVVFRSILLPLSDDQETVDSLVGGARCKAKPRA